MSRFIFQSSGVVDWCRSRWLETASGLMRTGCRSTAASMNASTAPLGLRERNQRDKLRRIKQATRELFVSKGFDDTTVREIATRADVAMGTVFLYADNKRDLLFLIANDELEEITDKALASFRPEATVLANLMRAFRPHY